MRRRKMYCAAGLKKKWSHSVGKISRVVGMKIVVEDSKQGITAAGRKMLETVNRRKEIDKTKRLDSIQSSKTVREIPFPIHTKSTPYIAR